ncbi:MAG TPA: glycosyltransferase family 4 protein [Candidatus Sulfotelmatobacter sp.]|nr:glycosyltransferase family 4 protein [Candidatus Sulfotelmatobacter sp.]
MKILWVKANKLLPVHSGGDIRSYHIARQLARKHELILLSYYGGREDHNYEAQLQEHFPGSQCVFTGQAERSTLARGLDYLGHLLSPLPYAVGRFRSDRVRQTIQDCLQPGRCDVAVCDFVDAAVNFPDQLVVPSVLFQHNVESEIWRRHASTGSNAIKRRIYALEFSKMARFERDAVRRFNHVIAVSEHDRSLMESWVEGARITVVPTGVDLRQYTPDFSHPPSEPMIMFVGAMDWEPNIDAMEYFCREIWGLVLAQVPGAKLRIVGRNPGQRVRKLVSGSVEVTGRVPSVADHLREAMVVVVPLRIGGGTRLKIYEAMAAGKAVVSTSVGAEGLDVHHGRDILLADTPNAFADSIVTLLRDENLRRRIERASAEQAARYDWTVIGDQFGHVLEMIARQRGAAPESAHASLQLG